MKRIAFATLMAAGAARPALAQDTARTVIRVRVSDSSGVRVEGAEVAILRGLHDTIATGNTAANGEWLGVAPRSASPYQVVARKIGLVRQQQFFMANAPEVGVSLTMRRAATQLGAVRITERESAARRSYFIDTDDIAHSVRPLLDAGDILIKLRPDMIYSRAKGVCPPISNIWINGVLAYRHFRPSAAGRATSPRGTTVPPPYPITEMARARASVPNSPASGIGAARLTILEGIKPEHVEQMTYKDCFDTSMKGNFGQNALFIVLKLGIRYELGVGTYAIEGGRTAK